MYLNDTLLAKHTEINDARQTVKFVRPEIVTTAMGKNNEIQIKAEKGAVIRDVIAYKGLQAGQEYRLEGILMDKQTGEPLLISDKEITSKKKFTPENSDGNVEVSFTFNAKTLSGKKVVVFEKLYISETEIAAHEDLNDEMQIVIFLDKPGDTTPRIPKLGYDDTPNVWLILSITASALCAAVCIYRRFKGREK